MNRQSSIYSGVVTLLVTGCIMLSAQADGVGDTPEFEALRARYINAVEANSPEAVGKLVTDDFVMLQPNKKGPDTYGRKSYVNYRKSLNITEKLEIEPEVVVRCGADTAFEFGKEYMDLKSPQKNYSTMTRYAKVLMREPGKGWRYARAIMAIDEYSYQAPPAPGLITNNGYATWEPRKQTGKAAAEAELIEQSIAQTKLMADTESTGFNKLDSMATPDEATGPSLGYGTQWEIRGMEEYQTLEEADKTFMLDDLRKIVEEIYVCDADTAYVFGQDVASGANLVTGERSIDSSDFFYIFSKQEGVWKLGPMAVSYTEL